MIPNNRKIVNLLVLLLIVIKCVNCELDKSKSNEKSIENKFNLKRISSVPKFTKSPFYISPSDVHLVDVQRSRRDHGDGDTYDYQKSYEDFLERNFKPKKSQLKKQEDDTEEIHQHYGYSNDKDDYEPADEYERIKQLSKQQSDEIKQNPDHCKTIQTGDQKCVICHNPKTNAKSESCSYASKPDNKKYAYISEKNYNSEDDKNKDDEKDDENEDKEKEIQDKKANTSSVKSKQNRPRRTKVVRRIKTKKQNLDHAETRQPRNVVGLDPFLYGSDDEENQEKIQEKPKTFEDYYSHVFPQQTHAKDKKKNYEFINEGYDSKGHVDKVLAEFKTRDWSKCKKVIKDELTCYHCKDADNVSHEECMYVSESLPTSSEDAEQTKPKSTIRKSNNKKNSNIKVRKDSEINGPEPINDKESNFNTEKRTIKRTVTYKINNNDNGDDTVKNNPKSNTKRMYFEQQSLTY